MRPSFAEARRRAAVHFFRFWTALAVVGACGYLWINKPEYLTWWKRSVDTLIEAACNQLPYPWGDRIEATLGNFGIWVQLTLAILLLRVVLSLVAAMVRSAYRRPRL